VFDGGTPPVNDECGICGGSGIADGFCSCDGNVDVGCGCGVPLADCSDCADKPYGNSVNLGCGCNKPAPISCGSGGTIGFYCTNTDNVYCADYTSGYYGWRQSNQCHIVDECWVCGGNNNCDCPGWASGTEKIVMIRVVLWVLIVQL
jgi:hypothetical protein